ncbi:unnamed protein product [Rhodiola kirilowii]
MFVISHDVCDYEHHYFDLIVSLLKMFVFWFSTYVFFDLFKA